VLEQLNLTDISIAGFLKQVTSGAEAIDFKREPGKVTNERLARRERGFGAPGQRPHNQSFAMVFLSGALVSILSFLAGIGVWMLGVRRYLQDRGAVACTSANWWVSAWSDWQQCSDFARANRDARGSRWARAFLLTQVGIVGGIVLALCTSL
jgi:hypothetical protein